jgi:MOFRL family
MEEIAGAHLTPDSLQRAWAQGLRPKDSLDNNDGHRFFRVLGDSIVTGPTLTNVNDFRAILIAHTPEDPHGYTISSGYREQLYSKSSGFRHEMVSARDLQVLFGRVTNG